MTKPAETPDETVAPEPSEPVQEPESGEIVVEHNPDDPNSPNFNGERSPEDQNTVPIRPDEV